MAFSISDFYSRLSGDGARPNLFQVFMTIPGIVSQSMPAGQDIQSATTEFSFMCRTAQLPGSSIGSVVVPYFGREIKLAGNRVFQDWTVTIVNDEDFLIRNTFEAWMNTLNSHIFNRRAPGALAPINYQTNGRVVQYGKEGFPIKTYYFTGMFPIDVSPIDVDWGSNDTIEEFTVTFQYQYWTSSATVR